jgi:Spy/CpxP family protein refolding chaperone
MNMKWVLFAAIVGACLLGRGKAVAQDPAKKQIVAANMDLTDAQAERFWPVYDQYTAELIKINDTKAALIQAYAQNYDTMTGDQAESYLRQRAAVEESTMQLRVKYIPMFRKVLSGRETALFFQIDWRLGLMIDLQLAQMPLINP